MSTNDSGEPIGNGITILPNLLEGDFFIGENDMERKVPLKFKNADGTFTTLPDDSRQLVGYDITGEEVYEGDEIQQVFSVIRAEPDYYELSVLQYKDKAVSFVGAEINSPIVSEIRNVTEIGFKGYFLWKARSYADVKLREAYMVKEKIDGKWHSSWIHDIVEIPRVEDD